MMWMVVFAAARSVAPTLAAAVVGVWIRAVVEAW